MKYRITKRNLLAALLPSFAFSLFYTVVLPLQSYLGNREAFDFGILDLLPVMLTAFVVAFLAAYSLCVLTDPVFKGLVQALIIALAIWGYLEVGVLSIGLPQIDGTLDQFYKPTLKKCVDLLVLFGLLFVSVILHRKISVIIHWLSLALIILSIASVFDSNTTMVAGKSRTRFDFGRTDIRQDVVKSAVFSTERNVIVVSLDATPCDIAAEILAENPELQKKFDGFTIYKNNIGMHEKTIRGLPSLATGRYLEKDVKPKDYLESFWGADSCLNAYLDDDYSMYVTAFLVGGFTNRPKIHTKAKQLDRPKSILFSYTSYPPYITFYEVMRFRLTPYRYKLGYIQMVLKTGHGLHLPVNDVLEDSIYGELKQSEIIDSGKTMHFYHTLGVSLPILRNARGEDLPASMESVDALKNYLSYIINILGDFFDWLKSKNLYQNSLIVITTDHGIVSEAVAPMPKSALLMVKPFGADSDFTFSDLPTSHSMIHRVLEESASKDLSSEEIGALLSQKVRKLRIKQRTPEKWWYFGRAYETYDIFFDEDGNEISRTNLGVFETL